MQFNDLGDPKYVALESFRKSGEGVVTPVWVAKEDDKLYVWTLADSWKVKRIRANSGVRLAICDSRGRCDSEWVAATARVLESEQEEARQRARIAAKYGIQFRLFSMLGKLRKGNDAHVAIELSAVGAL